MVKQLEPYSLRDAQNLVIDALGRATKRHTRWRAYWELWRAGRIGPLRDGSVPNEVWDDAPDLNLETVNLVLPHINIIAATIVAGDPVLRSKPSIPGEVGRDASALADILNAHFWHQAQATRDLRAATWDMLVTGNGFLKVGWAHTDVTFEDDQDDAQTETVVAAVSETVVDGFAASLEDDVDLGELVTDDDLQDVAEDAAGMTPTELMLTSEDEPYVERVSPFDILVPVDATSLFDARWVAQRIVLPIDEVKANEAFDKEARENVSADREYGFRPGGQATEIPGGGAEGGTSEHLFSRVTLYEFYDMRTRRLVIFQMGASEALYDEEFPHRHRWSPFVHLVDHKMNDKFWGFGEMDNVAPIQNLYSKVMKEKVRNARTSGTKLVVDKGSSSQQLRQLMSSDRMGAVAEVDLNDRPIEDVVQVVPQPGLSQDIYAIADELERHMAATMGINDFQQGGVGADRMSATAAAVVEGVATLRAQPKLQQVEGATAHAGQLLFELARQYLSPEYAAVLIPEHLAYVWEEMTVYGRLSDRRTDVNVSVRPLSTKAVNPAARQQRAMQTLQVSDQLMAIVQQPGGDELARHIARDLGLDEDVLMPLIAAAAEAVEQQQQTQPEGGGPMPPDAGQPPLGPDGMPDLGMGLEGAFMPEEEALGGPPVPAATEGDMMM